MIGRIASILCLLSLLSLRLVAVGADDPPTAERWRMLVLRNGEILEGRISQQDDRYVVKVEAGEIRLQSHDVDFLCQSLDEAYEVQSKRIVGQRIEDRLQLADWCIRHEVIGGAAQEITAAMALDPKDPRVAVLDRRLQEMITTPPVPAPSTDKLLDADKDKAEKLADAGSKPAAFAFEKTAKTSLPANSDDLERLARNLPRGSLESYSATVLPLLLNHCATAGCHAVGSQSAFILIRPTLGSATAWRMTLRDLHNTLDWVDYETPAKSKMLAAAHEPHGTCSTPAFEKEESREYQQLVSWVQLATQGDNAPRPGAIPAHVSMQQPPKTISLPLREQPAATPTTASGIAPLATTKSVPKGAGWVNTVAPPGKTPPQASRTPVPTGKSTVAAPAQSKVAKAPKAAADATSTAASTIAPAIDPDVKPASATAP